MLITIVRTVDVDKVRWDASEIHGIVEVVIQPQQQVGGFCCVCFNWVPKKNRLQDEVVLHRKQKVDHPHNLAKIRVKLVPLRKTTIPSMDVILNMTVTAVKHPTNVNIVSLQVLPLLLNKTIIIFVRFLGSRDLQPAKNGQLLCNDCRTHLKKTNELPPVNKEKDTKDAKTDKDKEPAYLFRPVAESPDASPQRMRTRNKAAKEQTSSRARPKRGGTETPEPKTPSKQGSPSVTQPNTPGKKKGKNEKVETPSKSRKRGQEKTEDVEAEEKELGLFKKKRERAEVSFCDLKKH